MSNEQKISTAAIRGGNRAAILRLLSNKGPMTRLQLCECTGLTGAAVSRITRELINVGLIEEGERLKVEGRTGRREVMLKLAGDGAFVLAITLTANRVSVGLANTSGQSVAYREVNPKGISSAHAVLNAIIGETARLLDEENVDRGRLLGAGVVVAAKGRDIRDGMVTSTALGWKNIPVRETLEKALSLPVTLQTRAYSLLCAELNANNPLCKGDVVLVNVGLGIGTAAIIDGQILHGSSCDMSHLAVGIQDKQCECGRKGCLELTGSGNAVVEQMQQHPKIRLSGLPASPSSILAASVTLAEHDDPKAKRAFFEAGKNLAHGIDIVGALVNPSAFILAGETGRQPDYVRGIRNTLQNVKVTESGYEIAVSDLSSNVAAIQSGLDKFVFVRGLNLDSFRAA